MQKRINNQSAAEKISPFDQIIGNIVQQGGFFAHLLFTANLAANLIQKAETVAIVSDFKARHSFQVLFLLKNIGVSYAYNIMIAQFYGKVKRM